VNILRPFRGWFDRPYKKAAELPDDYLDIVLLSDKQLLKAGATGQSITEVQADLTSRATIPLKVRIGYGAYFVSKGPCQNMAARKEYDLELGPKETKHLAVAATCINADRPIPGSNDKFRGVARISDNAVQFLQAAEREDAMTVQAGVWAITDNYTRHQVRHRLRTKQTLSLLARLQSEPFGPNAARFGMGITLAEHCGVISEDDIDKAEAILDNLGITHRLKPDGAYSLYERGIRKRERGDIEGALSDIKEAISIEPNNSICFLGRAETLRAKGDLEGALKDYGQAIRLANTTVYAFKARGDTRLANGDLYGAQRDYEEGILISDRAIHGRHNSASGYLVSRGNLRRASGDLEGALQDYDEAIRLDNIAIFSSPDNPMFLVMRGDTFRAKGDLEDALRNYTEALHLAPDLAWAIKGHSLALKAKATARPTDTSADTFIYHEYPSGCGRWDIFGNFLYSGDCLSR